MRAHCIYTQLENPACQKSSLLLSYGIFPEEPFLMRLVK